MDACESHMGRIREERQDEADRLRSELLRDLVLHKSGLKLAHARIADVEVAMEKAYWDGVFDCQKGVLNENSELPITFSFIPPERIPPIGEAK